MNTLAQSGGVKEQLSTIYKQIREAQTLDVHGDEMVGIVKDWAVLDSHTTSSQGWNASLCDMIPDSQLSGVCCT